MCIYFEIDYNALCGIVYTTFYIRFSILKTFAQNKEDRKKVEKALETSGLPSNKVRKKITYTQ